ncbi:MAG: AmmeMemoRadiSam system radical SAM enzyme [bacterium]
MNDVEAKYYRKMEKGVQCLLCPQVCVIAEGETGLCRTRRRRGDRLALENYGRYTSMAMDPIEKKPLYHFHPGREILSIGGKGCNLGCVFCQNWGISHEDPPTRRITPEKLADAADAPGNLGVAFTYNEPFIWFEFIRDCAGPLRDRGKKVVLVTNGYVNPEPLDEILPVIDAMNVDLKSFDDAFYRKYCSGRLAPVKRTIRKAAAAGTHVEVTLLLVTGLNDGDENVGRMADWLSEVDDAIPFHISRFFPAYKLDLPPTPMEKMRRAYEIASEKLKYVYLGNLGDPRYSRTRCPSCGEIVIERTGYSTRVVGLKEGGACAGCGSGVDIEGAAA